MVANSNNTSLKLKEELYEFMKWGEKNAIIYWKKDGEPTPFF